MTRTTHFSPKLLSFYISCILGYHVNYNIIKLAQAMQFIRCILLFSKAVVVFMIFGDWIPVPNDDERRIVVIVRLTANLG